MDTIEQLKEELSGAVLTPADPGFDTVRRVRNARIDARPSLIVRCRQVDDVITGIGYARQHKLPVAIRGGGSHVAGWGTCNGGLLLDLGPMTGIEVDPEARLALVEPGVCWGEFDTAAQRYGLAVPGTRLPTVGVAGHTLGGGVGDLSRQFGLTCDSVTFFDMVTAQGERVRVSAEEHPELFWGLRGGGGNFGVVTRFGFRLHPVERVVAGPLAYPLQQARTLLPLARDWLEAAPDEASLIMLVWTAPPARLLPEAMHFERCVVLIPTWFGDPARADEVLAPLREMAPLHDDVRPMSYLAYHRLVPEPHNYQQQRVYNRGEMLTELSNATLHSLLDLFDRSGPNFSLVFGALGGAIGREPAGPTAFAHRHARWFVEICAQWFSGRDDDHMAPVLEGCRSLQPISSGPYGNLLPDSELVWAQTSYGSNYLRLARLKRQWDPNNLFCFNVNIRPEAVAESAKEKMS
jgi:FAD/FMN-containing dehydrogenase